MWAVLALFTAVSCQSDDVILCENGKAVSRIVIPSSPTEAEKHASVVLQNYLKKITGADFAIVSDESASQKNDIQIGHVDRPEISGIDFPALKNDGYVIQTKNNRLTIAGGANKGTIYGVYGFLEKYLNCRKYSSKVSVVPVQFNIALNDIDVQEVPVFEYREVLYKDVYDPEYMEWHGLGKHQSDAYGTADWGSWCHTTLSLVPPKEYGAAHPEYYSMINGKRRFDATKHNVGEICWSSEGAFKAAAQHLQKMIADNPDALYWSVSQQDNADYCRCPVCQKAYDETGSTQGTIIPFINKMAREFPDKTISTLAYWYSTRPPKGIKVEKNVNIMLCNIGSPRHIPIEEGDSTFTADIKAWHQIHDNFIIWDYVIQFAHLMAPFPNLRTLQPNLQFLHKNGVKSLFEQGNRETGGEFCELRAYLIAKLMWNPYQDIEPIIDDFLNGYYGPAGQYIRQYIDLMHDKMQETKAQLSIFGRPWDNRDTFLTEELLSQYYALLEKAAEAVKDYPEYQSRVVMVKAQIDYAVLDIARQELTGKRGAMELVDGKWVIKKEINDLLQNTMNICNLNGVTRVHEWNTTPHEYITEYYKYLDEKSKVQPVKNVR